MKPRSALLMVMLVCACGLVARAELSIMTADGAGADTYLSNDNQNDSTGPDINHGEEVSIVGFRQLADTRSRTGYVRFDLSLVEGSLEDAILTLYADSVKGGTKTVNVYGVIDGAGDYWDETGVTYNTAAGLVPNPPTTLGNAVIDEAEAELLGTFTFPAETGLFSSEPVGLDLAAFLNKDTNGLVTLIFIGDNNEGSAAAKENTAGFDPPTLTLPDVNDIVARATDPVPAPYETVSPEVGTLSWTNPEPNNPGETISCDVYWGTTEPNVLLPHYGYSLLQAGVTDASVTVPVLEQFTTYYWVVDVHDSSFPNRVIPGKVWVFDTNNQAPAVDAGDDQYVWLTKQVVSTGSSNDTYMRDATDRGGMGYMDVRYGGSDWGFGGYLQFDLSDLTAMGPGTLSNATLTLRKVAGSRDDTITNDRFSLHGLNNGVGATPQNWDEHLLNTDTVGDEWAWPFDPTSALVSDLDENAADVTEVIENDVVTVTGADLEAFLQGRVDDNGLVTFIITCEVSGKGYGIASKENETEEYRPVLSLTYVPDTAPNNGDAEVVLDGTVSDDGLPAGSALSYLWTQLDGPVDIAIDPNDTEDVTVSIGTSGFYEFQLEASDGQLTSSDTVQVYVGLNPCDAAQNTPDYEASIADLNSDCFVNLEDFLLMAIEWLDCTSLQCP